MRALFVGLACSLLAGASQAQDPQSFGPPVRNNAPVDVATVAEARSEVANLAEAERILGVATYSELMSGYERTEFRRAGRAVGRLMGENPGEVLNLGTSFDRCTAWLVDSALILTARHCVAGPVNGAPTTASAVQFGFVLGNPDTTSYNLIRILEADEGLDYAIVELGTPIGGIAPGVLNGVIRVGLDGDPDHGEPLYVIHHPYGYSQLLLKDSTCRAIQHPEGASWQLFHRCDTRGGSSGAPVFSYAAGFLPASAAPTEVVAVGLHTAGHTLENANSVNQATRLSAIVNRSPILRRIACSRNGAALWSCPSIERPEGLVRRFDFPNGDDYIPRQPDQYGILQYPGPIRQTLAQLVGDLNQSNGFVKVRIVGDARLAEFPPATSAMVQEHLRRARAYRRAEQVRTMIPSLPYGQPYVVEVDYRRMDGVDLNAGSSTSVEVFVEYIP